MTDDVKTPPNVNPLAGQASDYDDDRTDQSTLVP